MEQLTIDQIPQFHERDTWWCSLGLNVGDEEDGKHILFERPVVLIHKFNKNLFIGLPLTTSVKNGKFYFPIVAGGKESVVILSQIRILDARRLQRRIGEVSEQELREIKRRLGELSDIQ